MKRMSGSRSRNSRGRQGAVTGMRAIEKIESAHSLQLGNIIPKVLIVARLPRIRTDQFVMVGAAAQSRREKCLRGFYESITA